jgi:hypothetical protein
MKAKSGNNKINCRDLKPVFMNKGVDSKGARKYAFCKPENQRAVVKNPAKK